jgi:hypothetical protein
MCVVLSLVLMCSGVVKSEASVGWKIAGTATGALIGAGMAVAAAAVGGVAIGLTLATAQIAGVGVVGGAVGGGIITFIEYFDGRSDAKKDFDMRNTQYDGNDTKWDN